MDDEEFESGMKEENVYSKKTREDLVEADEISPEEEAFMAGYDEDEDDEKEEDPFDSDKWPDED